MRETFEKPEEEKGFQKHHSCDHDNDDLLGLVEMWISSVINVLQANRVRDVLQASVRIIEWCVCVKSLQSNIAVANPDVALIKVVPDVAEVLGEALLLKLSKVVDRWIDQ